MMQQQPAARQGQRQLCLLQAARCSAACCSPLCGGRCGRQFHSHLSTWHGPSGNLQQRSRHSSSVGPMLCRRHAFPCRAAMLAGEPQHAWNSAEWLPLLLLLNSGSSRFLHPPVSVAVVNMVALVGQPSGFSRPSHTARNALSVAPVMPSSCCMGGQGAEHRARRSRNDEVYGRGHPGISENAGSATHAWLGLPYGRPNLPSLGAWHAPGLVLALVAAGFAARG